MSMQNVELRNGDVASQSTRNILDIYKSQMSRFKRFSDTNLKPCVTHDVARNIGTRLP